ncbi:MAG: hypothetical protein PHU44_13775 [Syntrophales bacterium]|nr:hypothetical protein [Syntrophales bacterium]MDD5642173.1 hypothetical protein [Syntrophales bacterium]
MLPRYCLKNEQDANRYTVFGQAVINQKRRLDLWQKAGEEIQTLNTAESEGKRAFNAFLQSHPAETLSELLKLAEDFAEGVHIACGDYAVEVLGLPNDEEVT